MPCNLKFGIHFMKRFYHNPSVSSGVFLMELPELSLAPSWSRLNPECSSSESSDTSSSRKRKAISDSFLETKSSQINHPNIIDLQHNSERLPLDWEQCLDLESGKMYFLNKKTLKKSWDRPTTSDQYRHQRVSQKLDLELNISSPISGKLKLPSSSILMKKAEQATPRALDIFRKDDLSRSVSTISAGVANFEDQIKKSTTSSSSNNDNMVAMACMNCHMLVLVSKSSPTCPNCKFVHSILQPAAAPQTLSQPPPRKPTASAAFKPLDTLALFS